MDKRVGWEWLKGPLPHSDQKGSVVCLDRVCCCSWASRVAQLVKNLPAMRETWVGKIPWRRERPPTPVFWPGESHGLKSPQGAKSQTRLSDFDFTAHGCAVLSAHNSGGLRPRLGLWEWAALELCCIQPLQLHMASLINCVVDTAANDCLKPPGLAGSLGSGSQRGCCVAPSRWCFLFTAGQPDC